MRARKLKPRCDQERLVNRKSWTHPLILTATLSEKNTHFKFNHPQIDPPTRTNSNKDKRIQVQEKEINFSYWRFLKLQDREKAADVFLITEKKQQRRKLYFVNASNQSSSIRKRYPE